MSNFEQKVRTEFSGVASDWNLDVAVADSDNIALVGVDFALRLFLDRDGVNLSYVSGCRDGFREYALGHFLATRRTWIAAPEDDDRIMRELRSYSATLESSAKDVLSGDRSWLGAFPDGSPVVDGKFLKILKSKWS